MTDNATHSDIARNRLVRALEEIHSLKVAFMHNQVKGEQFTQREAESVSWLVGDIIADLKWISAEIKHNHKTI